MGNLIHELLEFGLGDKKIQRTDDQHTVSQQVFAGCFAHIYGKKILQLSNLIHGMLELGLGDKISSIQAYLAGDVSGFKVLCQSKP